MPDATGSGGNSHFGVEPLIGGKLMFENEAWRLSAGFDYIIFDQNFTDTANLVTAWSDPALQAAWHNPSLYAAQISQIGRAMSFYALGASYEKYDWTLQAEVGYLHSDWLGFRDLTSGYLSIGRHFGSLTPYTVFSMAGNVGSVAQIVPPAFQNVDINQLYTGTQAFMTGFPIDQKTVSLGLRWDALENMAFKLQWDYSLIAAKADSLWLSTTGLPNTSATNVNVFSASVVWAY